MKAEIKNENKARFFALYWGQRVARFGFVDWENPNTGLVSDRLILEINRNNNDPSFYCYLELKPLSSISDEDAIEIGYQTCSDEISANYGCGPAFCFLDDMNMFDDYNVIYRSDADYLRSRGYLISWIGLSPEEIIEAGWAKYKEE